MIRGSQAWETLQESVESVGPFGHSLGIPLLSGMHKPRGLDGLANMLD